MFEQFDEYQARAQLTAAIKQGGRVGKVWSAMEFGSEWMELGAVIMSGITKSQFRPKGKPEATFISKLEDELGDALWTLAVVANSYGLRMSELARKNLVKVGQKHINLQSNKQEQPNGGSTNVSVVEGPRGVSTRTEAGGAKPKDPFPWTKGNKKAIKNCPKCGSVTRFLEGCVSCGSPSCGWSAC